MTSEKKRLRVGVIFGGRSGEHEVSLASAASVIRALDPAQYEVVPIGITKDGRWLAGSTAQKMLPEVLRTGQHVMLSAEPNAAALVPLEKTGSEFAARGRGFSGAARHVRRGRHGAGPAGTGRAAVRRLGRAGLGGGHGQGHRQEAFHPRGPAGGRFHRHSAIAVGAIARQGAGAGAQEVPLPGVREAGGAGLFGGHDESA